ncbi:MAG TPA: hypothetical protein VFK03_03300 [Candidatus Saccharimonadales bacterium]|nr:hypothetical protein [Candidatus Saccharimonadales bacterium]
MAPKQDEPAKPNDDGYEPQPVDNVDSYDQPDQAADVSTEQSADTTTPADEPVESTTDQPADDRAVNSVEPSLSTEPVATEPQPADSQTTYVNPNNDVAFGGAAASGLGQTGNSRRKKLAIGLLIGLLVILAIMAGLWFWYNSTSKVMGDAIDNLLAKPISSSQGDFNVVTTDADDVKVSGTFSTRQASDKSSEFTIKLNVDGNGMDVQVPLDVIAAANGDLYVKVSEVKQLLTDLLKSQNATSAEIQQMQTYFGGLISQVDDKWVKISKQELSDLMASSGSDQPDVGCTQSALQQFYSNPDQQNEIKKAFTDHPFLTVDKKLGSKDVDGHASLGYSLKANDDQAEAFGKAVEDSQLFKQLEKCGFSSDSTDSSSDNSSQKPTVNMEVWVDKWNHQFTQFSLSVKDKTSDVSINLRPSFDEPTGSITTPKDATTVTELKTQLQNSLAGLMLMSMSSQSSSVNFQ